MGDLTGDDELLAAACRADVEGRVVLGAVRDDAGVIVDLECLAVTPAACALLGQSSGHLVGRRWRDLASEARCDGFVDECAHVIETGRPALWAQRRMPVGSSTGERDVDLRIVKVADGVSVSLRDVTDRVLADTHLVDSDLLLRAMTRGFRDVVLVLAPDDTVTYCSQSLAGVLGWEPEDLIGQDQGALLHPDDRAPLDTGSDRWTGAAAGAVRRMRHRDGSYRWIEASTQPLVSTDGSVEGHVAAWRDVSDRVEADRRIAASEAQLRLLTENMHDVVVMADADFLVTYCSPSVTALLGWAPEDLVGRPSHHLLHPDDLAAIMASPPPEPVEASGGSICPARVRGRDGSYRWIESASKWVLSPSGEPLGFTSTWRDIHDRVAAEAELERRARVDFLTGLANRSEIIDSISRAGRQTDRAGSTIAVLFCDIDHFKDINDEYGHAAGDEVLRVVSERICAAIRHGDRAGRVGGDEILVVLEGVRGMADATAIAEKIRQAASRHIALAAGARVAPTLSIGATILLPGESVDDVIARADSAMYTAKESGRDRVAGISG